MPEQVYKVCHERDWREAERVGRFAGSAHDLRDGYIHMSTASQLAETLRRHYADASGRGLTGLLLIALDPARLGPGLRWEPARDGTLFPHLYGPLDPALAAAVRPLAVGPDGRHVLNPGESNA